LDFSERYKGNEHKYPKYDNYDAINVDKVKLSPCDYYGVMGVPITFLDKFNPSQFRIVGFRKGKDDKDLRYIERESFNHTSESWSAQQSKRHRHQREKQICQNRSSMAEIGMIKNTEAKIDDRICYARLGIQRTNKGHME
jgi:hypothetical protein